MIKSKLKNGFSLVEMLVVITVFSILAIVATQSLAITLKGSRKSDATIVVRENLRHALSVIERQLYNAESVECASNVITYHDEYGSSPPPRFLRIDTTIPNYIASGSAALEADLVSLTTDEVDITQFTVSCTKGVRPELPDTVEITVTAVAMQSSGAEGSQVTTTSKILLRSY